MMSDERVFREYLSIDEKVDSETNVLLRLGEELDRNCPVIMRNNLADSRQELTDYGTHLFVWAWYILTHARHNLCLAISATDDPLVVPRLFASRPAVTNVDPQAVFIL